jgi:hypothetical protein
MELKITPRVAKLHLDKITGKPGWCDNIIDLLVAGFEDTLMALDRKAEELHQKVEALEEQQRLACFKSCSNCQHNDNNRCVINIISCSIGHPENLVCDKYINKKDIIEHNTNR